MATCTKAEVVRLVKEGNTAIAWITSKGALVYIPTQPVGCIAGVDASFFDDSTFPEPVLVVDGVKGLSAVDPKWDGALPYTILVDPGGKIVYAHQGAIDAEELKKVIFDNPMLGRIYKEPDIIK